MNANLFDLIIQLKLKLSDLEEFDGDASWFKDNSQSILSIIELAKDITNA